MEVPHPHPEPVSLHKGLMVFSSRGVVSCHFDCSAHMDSGLVKSSILAAPRRTCAVPCVYTRSFASVGNVYPAEVQQRCAFSQLH